MIIDCTSDLHGFYPKLDGGDLLIVAGDCVASDTVKEWSRFFDWFQIQKYRKKILVAGNHDAFLESCITTEEDKRLGIRNDGFFDYLCDSGTEFEGLKIWGSPWTKRFKGMNPFCTAFTYNSEEDLSNKFDLIPDDTDILITHCPPYSLLDDVMDPETKVMRPTGSRSLLNKVRGPKRIRLHVFGHIHEHGGEQIDCLKPTIFVNASFVDKNYNPRNKFVRIEF